jgi:hypothetical protein
MNTCVFIYPFFFGISVFLVICLIWCHFGGFFCKKCYGFFLKINHIDNREHYDWLVQYWTSKTIKGHEKLLYDVTWMPDSLGPCENCTTFHRCRTPWVHIDKSLALSESFGRLAQGRPKIYSTSKQNLEIMKSHENFKPGIP